MVNHTIRLVGARFLGAGAGPAVLQRTDPDFLDRVLAALGDSRGRPALAGSLAADRQGGVLSLYQPVHRTHHLVVLEAYCERPGEPRLDPERIESAGLVLRREAADGALEGWLETAGDALGDPEIEPVRGWRRLVGPAAEADPDPSRRRLLGELAASSGRPEIDRLLALARRAGTGGPLAERVSPLFVAPPEICQAAGRTLLYGVVPAASLETERGPEAPARVDRDVLRGHLSPLLRRQNPSISDAFLSRTVDAADTTSGDAGIVPLLNLVRQLRIELGAFEDTPEGRALRAQLDRIALPYGAGVRSAGAVLEEAARVLVEGEDGSVTLPDAWPAIPEDVREALVDAASDALSARLGSFAPGRGRFEDDAARYRLRAFVRLQPEDGDGDGDGGGDGCPPKIVWSAPGERFRIVPWYEGGTVPPVRVKLPDPTDREALKKAKPGVAFEVPESLKNMIDGTSLDALLNGDEPPQGPGIGLGWICGFNIPFITICAFFVLNIFLQLLNFVFWWLAFIKICIPFPVATPAPEDP
jgi:hypothetical protein